MALVKVGTLLLLLWSSLQLLALAKKAHRLDDPWEREELKRLNSQIFNDQSNVKVVATPQGEIVAVWETQNGLGQNSGNDVFIAKYDSKLRRVGFEQQLTDFFDRDQDSATIAVNQFGRVMVVYENQEQFQRVVRGSIWDSSSMTRILDFGIEANVDAGADPVVVALDNNNFVVAFTDPNFDNDVSAYIINQDGQFLTARFQINARGEGNQQQPAIAAIDGGGFVVVYESDFFTSEQLDVVGQIYLQNGERQGGEFIVNTFRFSPQEQPSITRYNKGFVVAWQSSNQANGIDIYCQRFDNFGTKRGSEILVNSVKAGNQLEPSVAEVGDGFVVTWTDETRQEVLSQRFGLDGKKKGEEFRVSSKNIASTNVASIGLENGKILSVFQARSKQDFSLDVFGVVMSPCADCKKEKVAKIVGGVVTGVLLTSAAVFFVYKRRKSNPTEARKEPHRRMVSKMKSGTLKFTRQARHSFNEMFGYNNKDQLEEDEENPHTRKESAHYNVTSLPPPNGWKWTLRPAYRGKK